MNFLVVGAGAIGGYFGGRLEESGQDVTFLVREGRKEQLDREGLVLESVHGNFSSKVKSVTFQDEPQTFDVILISLKAYQMKGVIDSLSPYVHDDTLILPLLNGYRHYDVLFKHFGRNKVLGGLCFIESTLNGSGHVIQSSPRHDIIFGDWEGKPHVRVRKVADCFANAKCNVSVSEQIQTDIWKKYIFIASMSGITSLYRSPIGPILENDQSNEIYRSLIHEITSLAKRKSDRVPDNMEQVTYDISKALNYSMKSSLQRDMEKGLPTEGDHLQGYLLELAGESHYPILQTVYSNLLIYEGAAGTPAKPAN